MSQSRDLVTLEPVGKKSRDAWRFVYGTSLTWYLQDRLALQLAVTGDQANQSSRYFSGHDAAYVSLNYRFAGRLEAPGLIEPVHLH